MFKDDEALSEAKRLLAKKEQAELRLANAQDAVRMELKTIENLKRKISETFNYGITPRGFDIQDTDWPN